VNNKILEEVACLDSRIEFEISMVMDSLKCRADKILEIYKGDMGQYVFDALSDQIETRYCEIKDWLKDEFFLRFNDEIFLTNLESVPIIPTKIDCHVDAEVIKHNRQNYMQHFIAEKLLK
jgi:hypothetical protein